MMQHGWRGGPHMRGGGMFGGRGGGFNSGGFRGRGGGRGGGGPGRPRGDRSRSPIRGKSAVLGEPADWEMRTEVILDYFNSDLNLTIDHSGVSATPLHHEGFAYMWGGARATYGIKAPLGKEGYPTHVCFEVRVGEKLPVSHLPPEESNPHVLRVGWSTDDTSFALGEEPRSWGYGGTAKKSVNCKFESYGIPFSTGDVVASFVEFDSGGIIRISYAVNGRPQGEGFRTNMHELGERALFPHVYTKNLPFEVNFGQQEKPWFPVPDNYTFIESVPIEKRVRGLCPPEKIEDCSMLMMCGLPGAGKTYWAEKHTQSCPDKRFTVLGTNNILDKMKVMGLPRKRNYSGRWDVLIELSTKCLNKLFEIASRRKRNYILDQTNVYPNAQRRKMRPFESFHRKAVVVVPNDDEFKRRIVQRTKEEGKEVPESAVLEMKANFNIPAENDLFEEIIFTELDRAGTEALVQQYNNEAQMWKRSGGSSAPSVDNRSEDSSAKFKPDRNYGRSSAGGSSTHDDVSSVSSFGRATDRSEQDRGMRGRTEWRGGRGGFRGGFNDRNDGGFRGGGFRGSGFRNDKEERSDKPVMPGRDFDKTNRGGFEGRRGGFQKDEPGRRFNDRSDSQPGSRDFQPRGGFGGNRQGFSTDDQSGSDREGFRQDRRYQGDRNTGFQNRNRGGFNSDRSRDMPGDQMPDQSMGMGMGMSGRDGSGFNNPGFGGDEGYSGRNYGSDRHSGGFGGRNRSAGGFESDRMGDMSDNYGPPDQRSSGMDNDPGSSFSSRGGSGFHDSGESGFGDRGTGGFGDRGTGGFGDRGTGGFGERGGGGYGDRGSSGFGERGGFSDRGGRFGDRGRYGGDQGGRYGGDRGGRFGDRGGRFGGDRGGRGFSNARGGSPFNSGFSGGRGGGMSADRGGFESGGFGDRGSGGFSDRGSRDEYGSGGYGGDRGRGGSDRGGGFSSNRGNFGGGDKGNYYGERSMGGYGTESSTEAVSSGRNRPKISRWSDAQPAEPSLSQPGVPDTSAPPEMSMARSGDTQQPPKGMGYGSFGGRNPQTSESSAYGDNVRHPDPYGGRQAMHSGHRGNYQTGQTDTVGFTEPQQDSGYDSGNRNIGYQDYGGGYQAQSTVPSQHESAGYNYGQETSGSYGPYSQPPPQLPQTDVTNYQQGYGSSNTNYSSWSQPPPDQQSSWASNTQSTQIQQQTQQNWQQWQQPPPNTSQQQQAGTTNEQWSYYQQPPPQQDWQQHSGYQ